MISVSENSLCDLPPSNYRYKTFLIHKPVNVVSSTIDTGPTELIKNKNHPRYGETKNSPMRLTVWDLAKQAGFPTDCGLVGRLDLETSGIMMFSNDSLLADAVRDPPPPESPLLNSPYKSKEYELRILSSKPYEESEVHLFDIESFEKDFSEPFSFSKANIVYHCSRADVRVIRRFRNIEMSKGRPNLGWTIDLRIVIREGKHHQIRRMAKRAGYHIVSLHRVRIANILSVESIPTPGQCR